MADEIQSQDKQSQLPPLSPTVEHSLSRVETTLLKNDNGNGNGNDESKIFGVTVRGWIALIFVISLCVYVGLKVTVPEVMIILTTSVISYYFGHSKGKSST
jgi:hypothetical protein